MGALEKIKLYGEELCSYNIAQKVNEIINELNEREENINASEGKLPLCDDSFAYELLKQWLEYAEGKQMSAPIEDTEKWISEYES